MFIENIGLICYPAKEGLLESRRTCKHLDEGEEDAGDHCNVEEGHDDPTGVTEDAGGAGGDRDDSRADVSDGRPHEEGDHGRPDDHAERAKDVDVVEGLGPQPDHEEETER